MATRQPAKLRSAEDPSIVGRKLRHRRRAAGLGLRELGQRTGLSVGLISMLETGYRDTCRAETLATLATALECEITDLMPPEPTARRKKAA